MIDRAHPTLSVSRQCQLLDVSLPPPGSGQCRGSPADGADRPPVPGVPLLRVAPHGAAWLTTQSFPVNRKRVQRLMRLMGLVAIYQRPNTSKAAPEHTKYPYLLGGLTIDRVNQVWCTDITYIPLAKGFIYLVAIMDWHSRAVLAWKISNTLHADFCIDALEEALRRFGRPEIFNTDQGSQFTSADFTGVLKGQDIRISMDGKGRCMDNIFVERLWRSLKYETSTHAYARPKPGLEFPLGCAFTPRNAFIRRTATGRPGRSTKAMPVDMGTIGCAPLVCRAGSTNEEMLTFAPMPTGINNNKDLEIENIAVTLRLAPTSVASIDTAQ